MTEEERLNRQMEEQQERFRDYSELQLDINRLNAALNKDAEHVKKNMELINSNK